MNCPHIVIESTPGVFYSLPVANSLLQGRRRKEIVELGDNDKKEDIINADEEMNKAAKMCQSNDCQYKREMQVNENGQSTCVENKRKVFAKKGWKSLNIAEEREKKVLEEKIGFSGQRFLDSECQDHSARAEAIILRRDSMRHIGDWFYPEGEWGWMVLITSLVMNVLSIGLIMSQGQVMVLSINARVGDETNFIVTGKNMIFEHLPDDVAITALVVSSCLSACMLISPVTMYFCLHKSPRLAAFLGGFVMALGWLFTSFATKLHQIIISYSLLLGMVDMVSYHCN